MQIRQVLILRFPALADDGHGTLVGVCEDPGTGEQNAFTSAGELWAIVQARLSACDPPRTTSRALRSVVRPLKSKPQEDS